MFNFLQNRLLHKFENSNATQIQGVSVSNTPPADDQVLTFDAGTGLWTPEAGGGGGAVSSVFARTGAVVAVAGDYTASEITNVPAGNITSVTVQAALNELDGFISAEDFWNRTGTVISTQTAGDSLALGSWINMDEISTPANPSANEGRLYVKDNGGITTPYFLDSAGTETSLLGGGGGISWGDSIAGTTGEGLEVNEYGVATQATAATFGIKGGDNFNTNSTFDNYNFYAVNEDNAGTGENTGFYVNNFSTELDSSSPKGAGVGIIQNGVDGTAISARAGSNKNPATNGLVYFVLNNAQSADCTVQKNDVGTSTNDNLALHLTGTRFSAQIDDADQAPGTTTNKLYAVGGNLYWNAVQLDTGGGGGGFTWSVINASQTAAVNNGYFTNGGAQVVVTLPATSAVGDTIEVSAHNANGWKIAQQAGQTIYIGNTNSTTGVGGSLESTEIGVGVELVCVVANTDWREVDMQGVVTFT